MPQRQIASPVGWAVAVRQRRAALMQRVGVGMATALVSAPLLGWHVSAFWLVSYMAMQAVEMRVFAPITHEGEDQMSLGRSALGGVVLVANTALYGSLSIPLWLTGGAVGGVTAIIMLLSACVYSMVNAPQSARVLACTLAPQFLYLAMTPTFLSMFGAAHDFVIAGAAATLIFVIYCITAWQRMNAIANAEMRSRLLAEQAGETARRALEAQTAFLAAVGHDLRTPISAILTGAAETARVGDAASRANASLITDAGLMMKAMLDDLLDHSKLGAGRMNVEAADFDLRQLFAQTLRLWQAPVRQKGLRLRVEGAHQIPRAVRGDAMRLRQVLNNLISNALKFTHEGEIVLRLAAWADEPSGYALTIEVADTGPGMSAAQLGRLFTPFDQTADGVSARHGGTGLGLAISRELVNLMGGRLTARSAPGEGARFSVSLLLPAAEAELVAPPAGLDDSSRLAVARALADRGVASEPRAPAQSPALAPRVAEPAAPTLAETADQPVEAEAEVYEEGEDERPLRVLVVDDHDINRRAVQLILQPLGCDIATAADGMAALVQCETTAFDVIFMDVRMPELDGRETTRRLRAGDGINARTPVIAVTADTAPEDIAACTAAGMDYFVSKPLTPGALLGALSEVLSAAGEADPEAVDVAA